MMPVPCEGRESRGVNRVTATTPMTHCKVAIGVCVCIQVHECSLLPTESHEWNALFIILNIETLKRNVREYNAVLQTFRVQINL